MKNSFYLFLICLLMSCDTAHRLPQDTTQVNEHTDSSKLTKTTLVDTTSIVNSDSVEFSNPIATETYLKDSIRFPLRPFYLSYDEWKTIGCIIAINEDSYWDKSMIGLIESSGSLRINFRGQKICLAPEKTIPFQLGTWKNTYQNDSIQAHIAVDFLDKGIQRHLTGLGQIELHVNKKRYTTTAYFVTEVKN